MLENSSLKLSELKSTNADEQLIEKQEKIVERHKNILESALERVQNASLTTQLAVSAIAAATFVLGADLLYAKATGQKTRIPGYASDLITASYNMLPQSIQTAGTNASAWVGSKVDTARGYLPSMPSLEKPMPSLEKPISKHRQKAMERTQFIKTGIASVKNTFTNNRNLSDQAEENIISRSNMYLE